MTPFNPAAMYDFYGRGVHSEADVREYLATWFRPIDATQAGDALVIDGKTYTQVAGFRRSDTVHGAFVNADTGAHVFALDATFDPKCFPHLYGSFDELLSGVASIYARLWKI